MTVQPTTAAPTSEEPPLIEPPNMCRAMMVGQVFSFEMDGDKLSARVVEFDTSKKKYVISYDNEEDEDEYVKFDFGTMTMEDDWEHTLAFTVEAPTLNIGSGCQHFYQGQWREATVEDVDDEYMTLSIEDTGDDCRVNFGCVSVRKPL